MDTVSYKDSGVDISEADRLIERIKKINPDIGGFGGIFPLPVQGYKNPCLVSGTDGVGTKLLVAEMVDRYDTVGIDLVAMVVNDLICCGAKPLFFLDYYATGKLRADHAEEVIKGIAAGCREAECALVGGETAELPGLYEGKHFDLAGFGVGIVDREKLIDGTRVRAGDVLIGLASSGIHSNGLSLARKVFFDRMGLDGTSECDGLEGTVAENLLKPTRIYVRPVMRAVERVDVRAIAHITGGGLVDNVPRVLPDSFQAVLEWGRWRVPDIFSVIEEKGPVARSEMLHTFNMGIGMILIVAPSESDHVLSVLKQMSIEAAIVGFAEEGDQGLVIR